MGWMLRNIAIIREIGLGGLAFGCAVAAFGWVAT